MVTSNKLPDTQIVKMEDQNNGAVVPQRTLLGEVNEHITCPLCRGYYVDATTIVECLHSFCRSCIIKHLQVKSYCPVCEMMINSAKPNIKLDKALQDIVYKLVPGLFQREMERRQTFYSSRPGPAASATPEQRGEDTERIIFSPEDVISFSLEYADLTDADSISSKSSDSNESQTQPGAARRYLQCPAVVNVSHLKKFLSMKFDIDCTQFAIDILYKRVPLPDYYTLMDIAYIYNWKRNEPMRFFYQIIDYVAIRNRLFDINRKGSHFPDRKSSPAPTEDTNASSPAPNLNDRGSEASSGTDSPMPEESSMTKTSDSLQKSDIVQQNQDSKPSKDNSDLNKESTSMPTKKSDDEVEKSQFLNSFELTAKSNATKSSPIKSNVTENLPSTVDNSLQTQINASKCDDTLKRKQQIPALPEMKKLKIELEKAVLPQSINVSLANKATKSTNDKINETSDKLKSIDEALKSPNTSVASNIQPVATVASKDMKQEQTVKQQPPDSPALKRTGPGPQTITSPKRKPNEQTPPIPQKTVSPLKIQIPKSETSTNSKSADANKPTAKKIPDLRPSISTPQTSHNKGQTVGKLRMDLLANNCDPTMDRSKILSQVKSSLSAPITGQSSGDPLKSLFDSCKINIPSSLSITLTDQKLDPRSPCDLGNVDQKKNIVNKNLCGATSTHKVPTPPVHNYIEILKLPDTDPKKLKAEGSTESKVNVTPKIEGNIMPSKSHNKPLETSAKGPIPNLKPIADTKLGKQSGSFSAPITFQQTFEQQLQSLQSDKKGKGPKNKAQVPKLVPATPKSFTAANKQSSSNSKLAATSSPLMEHKLSAALDLSTPHNIQSQLGPQQTKALETMQSIANLAKKQNLPSKMLPLAMSQGNVFSSLANRPLATSAAPLRAPSTSVMIQQKIEKVNVTGSQMIATRLEGPNKANQIKQTNNPSATIPSAGYQIVSHNSPNPAQPSPRSQTRSPSSSPKLVIAEEKQGTSILPEHNMNQSNQITSTQISNMNMPKSESPKATPGPSKPSIKPVKPMTPVVKMPGIRQPMASSMKPNVPMPTPADYLLQPQLISTQQAMLRHQMDTMHFQNAWNTFGAFKAAQRQQYDLLKNMANMTHQNQNDFNKDKQ